MFTEPRVKYNRALAQIEPYISFVLPISHFPPFAAEDNHQASGGPVLRVIPATLKKKLRGAALALCSREIESLPDTT